MTEALTTITSIGEMSLFFALPAKRADKTADITALEAEIDRLVYALYSLTDEEILRWWNGEDEARRNLRQGDAKWIM